MDRRVIVTEAHKKIIGQSVARLAVVCGNSTLPAIDRVALCGVLIFLDRRALSNIVSLKYETIGEVPVRFDSRGGAHECAHWQQQAFEEYGSHSAVSHALRSSL